MFLTIFTFYICGVIIFGIISQETKQQDAVWFTIAWPLVLVVKTAGYMWRLVREEFT